MFTASAPATSKKQWIDQLMSAVVTVDSRSKWNVSLKKLLTMHRKSLQPEYGWLQTS